MRSNTMILGMLVFSLGAHAGSVSFSDPRGDDNGPGAYTYPTGAEYKKGSFDLTGMKVKEKGDNIEFEFTLAVPVEDPWDSAKWPSPGNGFSLQMFQIYIDTDGVAGSGVGETLSGMNATFAEDSRWEKVIVVSPQANKVISAELKQKAKDLTERVVLPKTVKVKGKTVTASVSKKELGVKGLQKLGWQVLVASNEGFPKGNDILSRKVNEFEGQHRFGGGSDGDDDPHFVDCLAGDAKGGDDEIAAQHNMLKFDEGKKQKAVLQMVRR
jgi:carbohydrate-binding DOMON domain-containing protein